MDFASLDWDVATEANKLTNSLFGSAVEKSKKSKKRKQKKHDETELPMSQNKKAKLDNQLQLDKSLKSTDQNAKKIQVSKSENVLQKKKKIKGQLGKNTSVFSQESKSHTTVLELPKQENSLKRKRKNNKSQFDKQKCDSLALSDPNELKMPSEKAQMLKADSKTERVKNSGFKLVKTEDKSAQIDKSEVNNRDSKIDLGESEEAKTDKKKKKRKRKCKKNKFKDYSKDEAGEKTEKKAVSSQSLPSNLTDTSKSKNAQAILQPDETSNKSDGASVKGSKMKKKKAAQFLNKSEISNQQTVKKSNKSSPKSRLDPKTLSAILSTETDTEVTQNHKKSDKNQSKEVAKQVKVPKTLLEKSREQLKAARFRYLNEQMYTKTGREAFAMFSKDGQAFQVYHEGFQGQVEKWPTNPIDLIIEYVKSRPKHMLVADFGCGDAKLARSVPNKVHSFDLVALNDHVTVCDMSKVPLKDLSVDIVVFCLSLMGTNLAAYLREANRVLRQGGVLKVAEVASRFDSVGNFVLKVEKMGFKIINQDASNKMFVLMDFRKTAALQSIKDKSVEEISLKPCLYKKR